MTCKVSERQDTDIPSEASITRTKQIGNLCFGEVLDDSIWATKQYSWARTWINSNFLKMDWISFFGFVRKVAFWRDNWLLITDYSNTEGKIEMIRLTRNVPPSQDDLRSRPPEILRKQTYSSLDKSILSVWTLKVVL